MKRDTIVLLLHDASRVPKTQIKKILTALGSLKELYLQEA